MIPNLFDPAANAASAGASVGAQLGSKAGPVGAGVGAGFGAAGGYIAGKALDPCPVRKALPDGGEVRERTSGEGDTDPAATADAADATPRSVEIPVTEA
ncbi:hypothetical protein [Halosegnis marinus]|uniref:Glycine zipper domain-containing protein n=1 Tax=Halosegnis marinus TaxID=3034023 RepID=A0ABD5ZNA6_9EURY|nr:hypothetical protein [Halosegnis sp. DT85]